MFWESWNVFLLPKRKLKKKKNGIIMLRNRWERVINNDGDYIIDSSNVFLNKK